MSDGFVVASVGRKARMASKSPVSATTTVWRLRDSSWLDTVPPLVLVPWVIIVRFDVHISRPSLARTHSAAMADPPARAFPLRGRLSGAANDQAKPASRQPHQPSASAAARERPRRLRRPLAYPREEDSTRRFSLA